MARSLLLVAIALVAHLQGIASAAAQSYPIRAVRFIVPFGAGQRNRHHGAAVCRSAERALGQAGGR